LEDPEDKDCDIYVILNSYIEPLVFELPKLKNKRWFRVVDTFFDSPYDFLMEPQSVSWEYQVQEKSVAIFISREEKFLA